MRIFNYELLKKIKIDADTLSLISEIKELTDSGYIKKNWRREKHSVCSCHKINDYKSFFKLSYVP